MLVLAPGAHSRVAVSARPEHWKGFQTSRPHHMDRKKLFIDCGAKYDWPAICFPVVFCAAGCYRLRKFLYGEGLDPHADPHGEMRGWKQWNKQAATSSFLDEKTPKSIVQQGLEDSTAVGKELVCKVIRCIDNCEIVVEE